jgi:medium-chain acyl-[acyl-carrier-protein] hydrolase
MIVSGPKLPAAPGSRLSRLWFESHFSVLRPSLRLFCFPYAGGNAQAFRGWQRYFLPDIDLCLVHLPGRGKRIDEPMFTRLDLLVQTVANLITSEPQPPYALFGHSMGALISFELTRELRRRHFASPRRLFLSGRGAPNGTSREVPRFNLPEEAFVEEVRRLNGTPQELLDLPESRNLLLPVFRADFEMVDTYEYHPEEPLSCPITVYGGLQDADASVDTLRAWEEHTSAGCNQRVFPGDHFFIHDARAGFVDLFRRDVLKTLHDPVRGT